MDPERWHEVDRLFAEALDRSPVERPAFLEAACAGDAALRREVERLLAADEKGAGFLAGAPGELLGLAFDERKRPAYTTLLLLVHLGRHRTGRQKSVHGADRRRG